MRGVARELIDMNTEVGMGQSERVNVITRVEPEHVSEKG